MGSGKSTDRIQVISNNPQAEVDNNLAEPFSNQENQAKEFIRANDRNALKKGRTGISDDTRIQEMS
jgi:hypothetical protein